LDVIAGISGLRYVGDIPTIGTGQIRVISITYLRLTYLCDRDNYLQNSLKKS
jgi:hypothetical protein